MTESLTLLTLKGLTKSYGGIQALDGVDFDLKSGEIHALCGENGAGKSTLIKILAGLIPWGHYSGQVIHAGSECRLKNPREAQGKGIVVIHQELALAPDLTVAENIFLGQELTQDLGLGLKLGLKVGIGLDIYRMQEETAKLLRSLGQTDIHPDQIVGDLTVGKRQLVEIARALLPQYQKRGDSIGSGSDSTSATFDSHTGRILILDEPTSALSSRESQILLDLLLQLKDQGLALIYVSHKLDEVFSIANRITILRNGKTIETLDRKAANPSQVISLMVGRKLEEAFPARTPLPKRLGPALLSVRNWCLPSPVNPQVTLLSDISFDLHAGEILGIAGLLGAGRTELVESLFGIGLSKGHGEVKMNGHDFKPKDPGHSIAMGLALVPEDRRHHGLMLERSIRQNLTSACLQKFCRLKQIIDDESEIQQANQSMQEFGIKAPHCEFKVGMLSGGNQQKVVLAKWVLTQPRILFLDDPTRGVDVGAKSEIYKTIHALAATGIGIILISSENEEVLHLAHRILVLRSGKQVGEFNAGQLNSKSVLELCAGGITE